MLPVLCLTTSLSFQTFLFITAKKVVGCTVAVQIDQVG